MAAKDVLGKRGEELAAAFLESEGYTILDRNWRCPQGEIDLVALDGVDTVFVEVKTRSSVAFGHPLEAITCRSSRGCAGSPRPGASSIPATHDRIRIDAIAVDRARGTPRRRSNTSKRVF